MKAINIMSLFEEVTDFGHLYQSMQKCKRGVIWKDSVASYTLNGIERTLNLEREIAGNKYKARPPKSFKIYSPKERDIVSICFRDRVYQRSLNDNIVYPIMTKSFIYDNWACQVGKGTDGARNRLKEFMHSYYRKFGSDGYVLKIDIKGYYPNMSHQIVEDMFQKRLPPDAFAHIKIILNEQYPGDTGYNPGSQLIQIAGISLLNDVDHFIKERLRIKYYLRYMDDFVLISKSKEELLNSLKMIKVELAKVECTISEKKTEITTLKQGVMFLGFKFRITDTGKVLMIVNPDNVKRARIRLTRAANKAKRGELPKEKVDEMYNSYRNHIAKGNSYNLLKRMDEFYKSLWEEM